MNGLLFDELSHMLIDYYAALLKDAQEKTVKDQRVYPKYYHDRFMHYGQGLEDVLRRCCGDVIASRFSEISINAGDDLVKKTKQLQQDFDVDHARQRLSALCKHYPALTDLMKVMNWKDVINLEKQSFRAMSTLIDDYEAFEEDIHNMRKKYGLDKE